MNTYLPPVDETPAQRTRRINAHKAAVYNARRTRNRRAFAGMAVGVLGFVFGILPAALFALLVRFTVRDPRLRHSLVYSALIGAGVQLALWLPVVAIVGIVRLLEVVIPH